MPLTDDLRLLDGVEHHLALSDSASRIGRHHDLHTVDGVLDLRTAGLPSEIPRAVANAVVAMKNTTTRKPISRSFSTLSLAA